MKTLHYDLFMEEYNLCEFVNSKDIQVVSIATTKHVSTQYALFYYEKESKEENVI